MRDEDVREPECALQIGQKFYDLHLYRHIKCRNGLVADDEFWLARESSRYRDTLTLTTGKLVRITINVLGL